MVANLLCLVLWAFWKSFKYCLYNSSICWKYIAYLLAVILVIKYIVLIWFVGSLAKLSELVSDNKFKSLFVCSSFVSVAFQFPDDRKFQLETKLFIGTGCVFQLIKWKKCDGGFEFFFALCFTAITPLLFPVFVWWYPRLLENYYENMNVDEIECLFNPNISNNTTLVFQPTERYEELFDVVDKIGEGFFFLISAFSFI